MSNPKEQFTNNIQTWVAIDNQLKIINEKTKLIRNQKNNLLEEINEYAKNNNIVNNQIEINDGFLKFYEKKEYSTLTYSYLEESLAKLITDKKQVDYIMKYLKENRQVNTSMDIRRNYTTINKS